jgi:imidazolonepropionase-like amidohydrolase
MQCIKAKLIYTGKGRAEKTHLVFNRGKVVGLSRRRKGKLLGEFPVVTPAMVDPHCHIGMHRSGEPSAEGEANPRLDSIVELADALDSVQMDDSAFAESVRGGVLYSCVVPGSGNVIGGRSAIIRNFAPGTAEALVGRAGVKGAFGYNPMSTREWKGTRPWTRMGALSLLRSRLRAVRAKITKRRRLRGAKKSEVEFSAEDEVIRSLLEGREVYRVHVHKADDIDALLRFVDEFGLRVTCEHTMDVHDSRVYAGLARRRIPVIYGPLDSFAYKVELRHKDPLNVRLLLESGVDFGLMTDHPVILQHTLLLTLRWFLRAGMSKTESVELVTRRNAKLLGLGRRLGTLEKGRWASFVCWTGDPFDLGRHVAAAWGEGRQVYAE